MASPFLPVTTMGFMNSSVTPASYDSCIASIIFMVGVPMPLTIRSYRFLYSLPSLVTVHCIISADK